MQGLKKSCDRDNFHIKILNSTRISDFREEMLEYKPHILHFCGHGAGDKGIIFESDYNGINYAEGSSLAEYLGNFIKHLECVVLNACYSESQAKEICKQVQYVVGMKEAIGDKIAIEFAISFYEAIFAKYSYESSYKIACDSVKLNSSVTGQFKPVLLTRAVVASSSTQDQHRTKIELYLTSLKKGCSIKLKEIRSRVYPLEGIVYTKKTNQHHYGAEDMDLRIDYQSFDESGEVKEREDDICKCINGTSKKVILLGEPGCGKSVSLLKLTINLVERALADKDELIPILIPLGSYKNNISPLEYVKSRMARDTEFVDDIFNPKRCLFVFDALNEVAANRRTDVVQFISELNRYIVSCRLLDYKKEFAKQSDVVRVEILNLDLQRIREAIAHRTSSGCCGDLWTAIGGNEALLSFERNLSKEGHNELFWKVPSNFKQSELLAIKEDSNTHEYEAWIRMHDKGLMSLCRNPMLLRMVYDLYLQKGVNLPENRGELFERFVDECLNSELRKVAIKTEKTSKEQTELKENTLAMLTCLAEEIIKNKQGTGILYQDARITLKKRFSDTKISEVETFARDTGILIVDDEYRFMHQLHQEYFASRSLSEAFRKNNPTAREFFDPIEWWEPSGWEEAAVILAGTLDREELKAFFIWLSDVQPKLVIRCIENSGIAELTTETLDVLTKNKLLNSWLARLKQQDEGIKSRIYLGQALDKLGDPRSGVGTIEIDKNEQPDIEWVNRGSKLLSVAKYPVTIRQYAAFVKASDGYINEDNWTVSIESIDWFNSQKAKPLLSKLSNAPITNISWYDAIAFCRWLSRKRNEIIRLPSEEEWIKLVNTPNSIRSIISEADLDEMNDMEKMVSVGLSEKQVETNEVVDVGLVWEWCYDIYGQKPADLGVANPLSLPTCILKGGSWRYTHEYKTSEYRFRTYAYHIGIDIGFRVIKEVCL